MYSPGYNVPHTYGSPVQHPNLGQSARPYSSGSSQLSPSPYHNGFNTAPRPSTSYYAQPQPPPPVVAPAPPTSSTSMSFRYYQPPKPSQVDTDSEGESSEEEQSRRNSRGKSAANASQLRRGACSHCKGLKVKCHFSQGQASCSRCVANKLQCVVNGRKKRRAVATHEELIVRAHRQDIEIRELLRQLDEKNAEARAHSWMAKSRHQGHPYSPHSDPTTLSTHSSQEYARGGTQWTSTASSYESFAASSSASQMLDGPFKFEPTPQFLGSKTVMPAYLLNFFSCDVNPTHLSAPDIITRGLIAPERVRSLFELYFNLINPYFSILDPHLHTPERLIWDSHFLFTVICTLAAKYDPEYAGITTTLREFVRDLAGKALTQGKKTIDECQAFLLVAVYQPPKKKWEEQRGWLHMGIAFSLAHELKLNEPISFPDFLQNYINSHPGEGINEELVERQWLNQGRTWLNCYCVDASHATQFGKPAVIAAEDYLARTCRNWYLGANGQLGRCSQAFDAHLVSYVEILRCMRRFRDASERLEAQEREREKGKGKLSPKEKTKMVQEMKDLVMAFHEELIELHRFWRARFERVPRRNEERLMCVYREETNRMNNAFNRLVVLFRGLQKAISVSSREGGGVSRDDRIVRLCIDTAVEVITQMTEKLHRTTMLRFSMDAHFLFVTYAAAHLLSLMSPKMSILLRTGDAERIDRHIRCLIDVLQSVAGTDREASPYQYARYLRKQLKKFSPVRGTPVMPNSSVPFRDGSGSGSGNNDNNDNVDGGVLRLDVSGAGPGAWADAAGTGAPYSGSGSGPRSGIGSGSLASPESYQDVSMAGVPGSASLDGLMPTGAMAVGNDMNGGDCLSGLNLNFSLNYFMRTVGNPSFAKATPPPDDQPHPNQQLWWQTMFPVSTDGGVPDGPEWPMAAATASTPMRGGGDCTGLGHGSFSPDAHHHVQHPDMVLQRAGTAQFHHMDVSR